MLSLSMPNRAVTQGTYIGVDLDLTGLVGTASRMSPLSFKLAAAAFPNHAKYPRRTYNDNG